MNNPKPLGCRDLYINVNEWRGDIKIHIRRYLKTAENELIPQKLGIALNGDEFSKLISQINHIKETIAKIKDKENTPLESTKELKKRKRHHKSRRDFEDDIVYE